MASKILMPKMGMTMQEGSVEEWKIKEGDQVKKGQIIMTVASDKLTNDVEAEEDGVVLKILVPEGESVPVSAVLGYIGQAGEAVPEEETPKQAAPAEAPKEAAPPAPAAPAAAPAKKGGPVKASPAAKKMAREKGVDLALVTPTGPGGRITTGDVEAFLASGGAAPETEKKVKMSPVAEKAAAELGVDPSSIGKDGRIMKADILAAAAPAEAAGAAEPEGNDEPPVKVDPLRRSIAKNMKLSWETSPRVTYTMPVDCTNLKAFRNALKEPMAEKGLKLTYNHIIIKVCAQALMEYPDVNSSFADNMLTHHVHANVGLAVAKGNGLIVPNIKSAEQKSLSEISRETEDLIAKTREGHIEMPDITGGTFTISSLGPFGVVAFSPIINQPELAILGVCDIVDTPVVRDGEVVIRPIMNLCLTADHRVVDGVMGAKFLRRVCELLENPSLLLM